MMFTLGLHTKEIIGFDSRFYLFALEMHAHGFSWFPTTYQKPYPDYLGTPIAFICFFAWLLGGLNKLVAVLPTAISAAITLLFTFLIGALQHRRWGLYAVFFAFMTMIFFQSARSISLDMQLTMITTICFYLLYAADIRHQAIPIAWLIVLLMVGFSVRGPIGLIIPAGVICIYYLLDKNIKNFFLLGGLALLLLVLCCAVLLFLAYQTGGMSFLQDVLHMEVVGRINNIYLSRYFYFTNSLSNYSISMPLMWLVIGGIFYYKLTTHYHSAETRLLIKLFGWVMIIMIGMSIPGDKKTRYILPIVPAAALIASYVFFAPKNQLYFACLRKILNIIFLYIPFLFLILLISAFLYAKHHALILSVPFLFLSALLFVLQLFNFLCHFKEERRKESLRLAVAACCFALIYINLIEPIEIYQNQSLAFVRQIESLRAQQHAALVFYKERPDGLPIKYLINMQNLRYPIFIKRTQDILTIQKPAFFITSESYFNALPVEIRNKVSVITKNKLGHVPVVVFSRWRETKMKEIKKHGQ
ncbi:MAG: glycosyltransferase family 39 protein [Gammaproteobacteria bacterium]|nr:glycosyltransferase family 39 protein [Gammaproteobacteria bacterium]